MIEHVRLAIQRAMRHESKLTPEVAAVRGLTSPKVRHLLNNLGSRDGLSYLEIGVHCGATFLAANYGNHLVSSTAIDNWSMASKLDARFEFYTNCKRFLADGSYQIIYADCFTVHAAQFVHPVSFYFYDGGHKLDQQCQALTHFYAALADEFILVVDDYNSKDPPFSNAVIPGTQKAIADLKLEVRYSEVLPSRANGDLEQWWNGLYVGVLRKTP